MRVLEQRTEELKFRNEENGNERAGMEQNMRPCGMREKSNSITFLGESR